MCECHTVGGPFIAEDPDCPIHGSASVGRDQEITSIIERVVAGEITLTSASQMIDDLYY